MKNFASYIRRKDAMDIFFEKIIRIQDDINKIIKRSNEIPENNTLEIKYLDLTIKEKIIEIDGLIVSIEKYVNENAQEEISSEILKQNITSLKNEKNTLQGLHKTIKNYGRVSENNDSIQGIVDVASFSQKLKHMKEE